MDEKRAVRFSRNNVSEFIEALSHEVSELNISITAYGDRAILILPFEDRAVVIRNGQSVVFGEVIPGSIPERHFISIRKTRLDT